MIETELVVGGETTAHTGILITVTIRYVCFH